MVNTMELFSAILDYVEEKLEDFDRPNLGNSIFDFITFGYYDNTKTIIVPSRLDSYEVESLQMWWDRFMKHYLKRSFNTELTSKDFIIFSFLHEIGHHVTMKNWTSEEIRLIVEKQQRKVKTDLDYRKMMFEYYADRWAICFIRKHEEILTLFNTQIISI